MADTVSDVLEKEDYMLSTADNPFNPFTEFDSWFVWDVSNGYNTCSLIARFSNFTDDLGDREALLSYYDAVEKILMYNVTGNYIKVFNPNK